ncbi:MAG: FHA domain-containing protein [Candidatus Limnocylindrales bacterium]
MPFVGWDPIVRASVFGGVFLVPLVAVLWLWYDSSGRADSARWYWRLILTALVLLTTPAVALGAANLDSSQQDLMKICGWLAIASGGVTIIGVLAYAVWGRAPQEDLSDDVAGDYAAELAQPAGSMEPLTLTAPENATVAAPQTPAPAPAARSGPVGAYLFVKSGADQGRQFPVGNQVTIGRATSCGITLADARVSSEHAQLKREGGSYVYLDLKSTNGSFLIVEGREERLRSSQALVDGDEVRLGQTVLKFIRVQEGGGKR